MIKASILLAALLAVQSEPATPDRYVPAVGWDDNEWAATFYERWYGNQLRAMNERPLSGAVNLEGYRQRFRLLVLPNSHPAFAYRVDLNAEGDAELRFVRLDGAGGYAPGHIADERDRALRPVELRRLMAALEEAALDSRQREIRTESVEINPDGTQTMTICLHATQYVFEVLDEHGRQFVHRPSCDLEAELQRLIQVVYQLRPPSEAE